MTTFVTWQLRVTLDSIRNSCYVYWQHAIDDLPFIRRQTARLRLNNVDSNFPIKDNRIYSWAELFVLKLLVICADMLITAMKMHENIHNYEIMKIIVKPSNIPHICYFFYTGKIFQAKILHPKARKLRQIEFRDKIA